MSSTVPKLRAPREPEIRAGLKGWIAETLGPHSAIIDELAIKHGKYRVDLCAITDRLHGYEIKSDQDTLKRLPAQSKHFSLVFHRMTLVIGPGLLGPAIAEDAKGKILLVPGVTDADVRITWEPAWNQQMISEEGKMKLGLI